MEKQPKIFYFDLIIILLFLGILTFIAIVYSAKIIEIISNPEEFRDLLISYGSLSILVFIGIQIFIVILAPIPGEFVLIAGGYIYGTFFGTVYSLIGIFAGSIIVFCISKYVGYSLLKFLIPAKKLARLHALVNHRKSDLTIFFFYLMPQMPKGILTYLAGLTPIEPVKFIVFSTIARIPCIIGSNYIGANLREKNFGTVIIVLIITGILLIIGFMMRKRIMNRINAIKKVKEIRENIN